MDERTMEIRRMAREGMTYREIGAAFGISRQRAYQIASDNGKLISIRRRYKSMYRRKDNAESQR